MTTVTQKCRQSCPSSMWTCPMEHIIAVCGHGGEKVSNCVKLEASLWEIIPSLTVHIWKRLNNFLMAVLKYSMAPLIASCDAEKRKYSSIIKFFIYCPKKRSNDLDISFYRKWYYNICNCIKRRSVLARWLSWLECHPVPKCCSSVPSQGAHGRRHQCFSLTSMFLLSKVNENSLRWGLKKKSSKSMQPMSVSNH